MEAHEYQQIIHILERIEQYQDILIQRLEEQIKLLRHINRDKLSGLYKEPPPWDETRGQW